MVKAVTAYTLKTHLGGILRALKQNERFVVLRRNLPVGILMSLEDYVKEHADKYEDVEDLIDTMLEESDTEFQRSLERGARAVRQGRFLSHAELKARLAHKRF